MDILRWHVDELPEGPMRESVLLFPSRTGGFRAPSVLDKPIRDIAKAADIRKHLTAKLMRRTFQDLGRAAEVHDFVTRAISGHATTVMHEHYSSVAANEVREGLARVISLARFRDAHASVGGDAGGDGGAQNRVRQTNSRALAVAAAKSRDAGVDGSPENQTALPVSATGSAE